MPQSEKQFENRVKQFLESEGIYRAGTAEYLMDAQPCGYYVKRWGGGQYIPDGLPDLQMSVCGVSIDVELKTENGRVSPLQMQKIKQMQAAGCIALVLRPSDFEEFQKLVKRIKRKEPLKNAHELFARWLF